MICFCFLADSGQNLLHFCHLSEDGSVLLWACFFCTATVGGLLI